jgi:protoporphyrinogen oxidase
MKHNKDKKVVIIGGGPAGLTAAYELCKTGTVAVVLEKDGIVGGISRTVDYKGYHFDIGGHRFFTKVKAVDDMWREVLGDKFLKRSRLSRIYYRRKFFYYPLRLSNALTGLGLWNSILIGLSYLRAKLFPVKPEITFEQWVSNRFGKRLYDTFFKSYTEKVWGMSCDEISAEWAAQRIKGLSLTTAVKNSLFKGNGNRNDNMIKTLISSFDYPKQGPGMMWEAFADAVRKKGGSIRLDANVEKIVCSNNRVESVVIERYEKEESVDGTDFISTMPIRELVRKLEPTAPEEVLHAADNLKYRDFVTVALIINKRDLFPDNWIYIHDSEVKVGRIQNYKNWSPYMVPDPEKTCLGLEYFCFEGDSMWTMSDQDLVELAKSELDILGLAESSDVEEGTVVRMPKAYPVYDSIYHKSLETVRLFVDKIENLQLVGRNGMHRYNNQDHSMMTAMLAVRNINGEDHDLWSVNVDQEYHEEDY